MLERSRTGMSVSRDSKQNILRTSFDTVRWWSHAGTMPVRFCTPALPQKGRLPLPGAKLAVPQPHSETINVKLEVNGLHPGAASRPLIPLCSLAHGVIVGYKITYDQAPWCTLSSASKKPQHFSMVLQPQSSCCTPHPWRESP